MRYTFDNNKLPVGILKEVLHNFNLPLVDVYTQDTIPYEDRVYIKEQKVVKYSGSRFVELRDYKYNKPSLNFTTNLQINSSSYDNVTHEYLGNYLRFIRDYHGIDLMGLYNCFGGQQPKSIEYSINDTVRYSAYTSDDTFNFYFVPVKLNKNYTIAIDSDSAYDIVAVLDKNMIDVNTDELVKASYKRIHGSKYKKPFIYSTNYGNLGESIWRKERNLKLLIKLPKRVNTSITVLEGDYRVNTIDNVMITNSIVNVDECYQRNSFPDSIYKTRYSLLTNDTKTSYPFADRLVEYLTNNTIWPLDEIGPNIKAVQNSIFFQKIFRGIFGLWTRVLTFEVFRRAKGSNTLKGNAILKSNTIRVINTDGSQEQRWYVRKFNDCKKDLLYYGDKDIKTLLGLDKEGI